MHLGAQRERNRLARGDRALRQVGGKTDRLPIMPSTDGIGELRCVRGNRAQFERSFPPQQDAHQARTQQQPQTVRQSLNYRRNIGRSVQRLGHIGQNLRSPVLLARNLAQSRGLQQAAELPGQDGGLRCHVLVKKVAVRIVQERHGADDFVEYHQRCSHQRTRLVLCGCRKERRMYLVDKNRPPLPHGLSRYRAFPRAQAKSDKALRHLAIGLLPHQLVLRLKPPEVGAADLEELAGRAAN